MKGAEHKISLISSIMNHFENEGIAMVKFKNNFDYIFLIKNVLYFSSMSIKGRKKTSDITKARGKKNCTT